MTQAPGRRPPHPPALVEPGPELSDDALARARRQLSLPGFDLIAQRRLRCARVLIVGAGGLGCGCAPYLAGAGIGTIGIVDDDRVDLQNLHRQVVHTTAGIGMRKTDSLARALREQDPSLEIITHDQRLTSQNALEILSGYDLVIDGSDNFATRYLVNDAAQLAGIPLVWGAILQFHGQVGVAWHAHGPGYRDLFPAPPAPEDVLSCASGGVLPGLCGTIGSLLATEAMKLICGIGDPLIGRVLVYDALRASVRELRVERDPAASEVTALVDYELFCEGEDAPPSLGAEELISLLRSTGQGHEQKPPCIIDVRQPEESERARLPQARLLPLSALEDSPTSTQDLTGPVIVHCERGPRSVRAARILIERGVSVQYLRGGIQELLRRAPDLLEGDDL